MRHRCLTERNSRSLLLPASAQPWTAHRRCESDAEDPEAEVPEKSSSSGKVRVYELAKEAGMKSKELADKLIELGYEIKGFNSSVDGETADKIRQEVLGQ